MSRSGYTDDCDNNWNLIRWRGAVASAIRGRRGQAFLREMLAALDALPEKRLIAGDLVFDGQGDWWEGQIIVGGDQLVTDRGEIMRIGEVCAMGAVGQWRGLDMSKIEAHEAETIADFFGISGALAKEIAWVNDDDYAYCEPNTPEARFRRVRAWVVKHLIVDAKR